MNEASVPRIQEFRPAVLRVLADGQPHPAKRIAHMAADTMSLSPQAREQAVPSGQKRYAYRVNWACSALCQAGLIRRVRRGWYEITDDGRTVEQRNLGAYTDQDMMEWQSWREYKEEVARRKLVNVVDDSSSDNEVDALETIQTAASKHNAEVETELRRLLQSSTPEFFERAVIELLWAMGYGGTHGEKEHVGRSGDGGIDGIIRQDALGLHNVYIQAKRYADGNNVQVPAIREFYGALVSRGTEKGVFITTSGFSAGATDQASSYRGNIVLIDGIHLTSLMLTYGVAVQPTETITLYEVDEDFFDNDM